MSIKKITTSAICIALATIFSMVKLYQFPFGGAVTLFSMLIIVLPAWIFDVPTGILCGLAFGILQFIFGPYVVSVPQVILDYVLAFSVMGVAGFFRNQKHSLLKGYIVAVVCRWIVATAAGMAWIKAGMQAWEGFAPLPYSMIYNGCYIFAEAIITIGVLMLPPVKKVLNTRIKHYFDV